MVRIWAWPLVACAVYARTYRLEEISLPRNTNTELKQRLERRCVDRDAGDVLMHISHEDGREYEWMTCDDPLQATLVLCAMLGRIVDEPGLQCARDMLGLALAEQKLGYHDAERATRALAAADATKAFNAGLEDAGLYFRDDFVTTNWALAWIVDELRATDARALEVGSYEGRSAWLWYRLLGPGSKLTVVDLNVADTFARNAAPLVANGFLDRVMNGRPSNVALFDLDPAEPFDLVYIDGSHNASHVLADMVLCDVLLKDGGLMVLDDIDWNGVNAAVRAFFAANADRYDVLSVYRQLAVRKRRPADLQANANGARYQEVEVAAGEGG